MEFLAALNPATGVQLPIPLFIISGVVLAACIVGAIVANNLKKKKSKNSRNKRRRK